MKNLLIYVNPQKSFENGKNDSKMAKMQIDNSLLFTKPENILLATNFPYEYHGVKAKIVPDTLFCDIKPKASKINVIIYLLEKKLLPDLTWFHDLDAFQIAPINLILKKSVGFTDYGSRDRWNTGSFFFKPESINIFKLVKNCVERYRCNEEMALSILQRKNTKNINSKFEKINITYNLGSASLEKVLKIAEKPIKVVHFPHYQKEAFDLMKPVLPQYFINLINQNYYTL